MAIYFFDAKVVSRSKGQSVVACAAYRAADKLYDERYEKLYDYERKKGVEHCEILLPVGAPLWMGQRDKLWNAVERVEKRNDAQLAREVKFSLPRELTLQQNIELTREFVNSVFVSREMVADCCIHVEKASDGGSQPHAHVLLTQREITENGFGKKVREWNKKENLLMWRKEWAEYENRHLALNGHDMRVDHRTLKEQGIDLIPQDKLGYVGSRHRMDAHKDYLENTRLNGEKLLARPETVLDVLTNQQSTFTHHDIARTVDRYTVDSDQFQSVYQKVKALPELVSLGFDDKNRERFTTKDMLRLESEMIGNAFSLHSKNGHRLSDISINAIAEKHAMSSQQTKVLEHIISDGDLKNVIGYAGTGKSRLLGAARELWEESGYRVIGATLSGIAAQNLEASSGIESRTLASRCYYWNKGEELLSSKDILVIDEAGMIGSKQMAEIMDEANKSGAKVILMGDPEQLQAIQAGAAFRGVIERTSYVELTEIWRQNVAWQKEAAIQFATQKTSDAMGQYAMHDMVHEFATQSQAMQALVDAWNDARISQPDQSQIMLAYTRDGVQKLNESARVLRQSLEELGQDYLVKTEKGEQLFAEGDRIYFLKNDRDLGVKNGTLGTIIDIDGHSLSVRIDKEDSEKPHAIQFSTDRYNHLDYGYASTIHKGQGITVDRSFVLASQYLDRHATYVAMTRHRDGAEIFWSKEEFPNYDAMVKVLGRERSKDLTLDHVSGEFDKALFAAHRGFDTLWDTFWEKYGREWLEKIQHRISSWVDGTKEFVETLQEQIAKAIGTQGAVDEKNLHSLGGDIWLKEMRAWVDEEFGRKNIETATGQSNQTSDSHSAEQHTNKTSAISLDTPVTDEQRAHDEARYHNIMKDAEMRQSKEEIGGLLDKFEKSNSLQSTKTMQKSDLDKEIDL